MVTIEYLYELFLKSTGVCTDTRDIKKDSIFFALKGGNFNGNIYAEEIIISCKSAKCKYVNGEFSTSYVQVSFYKISEYSYMIK